MAYFFLKYGFPAENYGICVTVISIPEYSLPEKIR
jgi:hypothetical protein